MVVDWTTNYHRCLTSPSVLSDVCVLGLAVVQVVVASEVAAAEGLRLWKKDVQSNDIHSVCCIV